MGTHVPWVIDGADVQINTTTGEIIETGASPTRLARLERLARARAALEAAANQPQAERNARGVAACRAQFTVPIPIGLQRDGQTRRPAGEDATGPEATGSVTSAETLW